MIVKTTFKLQKKLAKTFTTKLQNFVGGKFVESKATTFYDITNPVNNLLLKFLGHSRGNSKSTSNYNR
jgi:hypothetical protein